MARFRATVTGSRGEASRLGHHGISTKTNGWNAGVDVEAGVIGGEDCFTVFATGGSNGRSLCYPHRIAEVKGDTLTVFGKTGEVLSSYRLSSGD